MILYTPQNQLSLDLFKHPFESSLDKENRWVILASLIPWDNLASVYCDKLNSTSGRKSIDVRIVIAALIIKHKLKLDDRGVIMTIQENIYLQYFCGLKSFTIKPVFDASLFVDIRKRLGKNDFDKFNQLVIDTAEEFRDGRSRIKQIEKDCEDEQGKGDRPNKGTLKVDATIADQEITHPNDVKLLNECRENLERIIDVFYHQSDDKLKPRTYKRNARKDFLNFIKKKRKSRQEIRKGVRKQLQYVKRDIAFVNKYLEDSILTKALSNRDCELLKTIAATYKQQKEMFETKTHSCANRIVNIYQPYVRPMPRGKEKVKTEFGSKIDVSLTDGFARIDRLDWEAFNESTDLMLQLNNYHQIYGCYPAKYLGDKIYLTRKNRKILDELGIKYFGPPLGRPSKKNKENASKRCRNRKNAAQRNAIEAKFGQAKRAYNLNDIRAKRKDTSESWVSAIIFVINLTALVKLVGKINPTFLRSIEKVIRIMCQKIIDVKWNTKIKYAFNY